MPQPSTVSLVAFVAVVAVVAGLFWYAVTLRLAAAPAARIGVALAVLVIWLGIPAVLSLRGALDRYVPSPPPALLVVAALTIGTITLAMSPVGTALARVPLAVLVGFQVFRVPVEWLLHRLYLEGVVPVQMTFAGRNADIISGITAAALGLWLARGKPPRWVVPAWNVLGLLLLANIVIVAILSTPVTFRQFENDPPNLVPSEFPFVWLPSFLVQAALFGHLLVFQALRHRS
jgi:hypothetical protein